MHQPKYAMSIKKFVYFFGAVVAISLLLKIFLKEYRTFCHIDDIEMTIWDNKLIFGHYTSLFPPHKNYLEVDLFPSNEFSAFYISITNDSVLRIFTNTPFLDYDLSEVDFKDFELIIDDDEDSQHQWCKENYLYENPGSKDVHISLHSYIDHHSMVQEYRIKANDSTIYDYCYSPRFIIPGHSCWEHTFYLDTNGLVSSSIDRIDNN